MQELIRSELRDAGVLLATIDMPGRTMNVFSEDLIDALQALLERAERDRAVRAVVVTSGKPSFLAGADLAMVRGMTERARTGTRDEMFAYCGRLGRLFLRIERSAKPWVAAVNGLAMGGGLELALACRRRLAADVAGTLLGVPEVRLGLLPGAGGTQRLPRLAAPGLAFDLLLSGRSLDAKAAVAAGLFDEALAPDALLARALERARQEAAIPYRDDAKYRFLRPDVPADGESAVAEIAAAAGVTPAMLHDYPAYRAIVRAVLQGADQPLAQACDTEMTRFLELMFDPVAGNMIAALFLDRQRLERLMRDAARVVAIAHGPLSARAAAWAEVLARAGVPVTSDALLGEDEVAVRGADDAVLGLAVCDLDAATDDGRAAMPAANTPHAGPSAGAVAAYPATAGAIPESAPERPATPSAVLSPPGPHGRVVEVVGLVPGVPGAALAAGLARAIRAIAYWTPAGASVLAAIRDAGGRAGGPRERTAATDADSDAFARMGDAAAAAVAAGRATDPALLGSAAVLAGLMPAYTGGPLAFRAQHGTDGAR